MGRRSGDAQAGEERPRAIIAHTRKGGGVSFMEPESTLPKNDTALYGYHSGAPGPDEYELAATEITERLDARLAELGAGPVELVTGRASRYVRLLGPAAKLVQRARGRGRGRADAAAR